MHSADSAAPYPSKPGSSKRWWSQGLNRVAALVVLCLLVGGCGGVRALPGQFNPAEYTPVEFALLQQDSASLKAGQLIRTQAYFWQFLTYDPSPQYYYFNQLRHPRSWSDLEWFALYERPDMTGYFDRGAMSYEQRLQFDLKRLDYLIIYGELIPMGGSRLYLQVHHLERVALDD